jgi:hypothetical protein
VPGAGDDLTARLNAWAEAHSTDASAARLRLRLRLQHERLLARMDVVLPLLWTVRGGRAIDLRLDGRARRTADLDASLTGMAPPDLSGVVH